MKKFVVTCGLLSIAGILTVKILFTTKQPADTKISSQVVHGKAASVASTATVETRLPAVKTPSLMTADRKTEPAFAAFADWAAKYQDADVKERAAIEAEGVMLAKQRRDAMKGMIEENPERALALAVPYAQRTSLPSSVVEQLEQQVNGKGDIHVGYACAPERAETILTANINGQFYQTYTGGRYFAGSTRNVTLNGISIDGALALSKNRFRVMDRQEAAARYPKVYAQGACAVCNRPVDANSATVVEAGSQPLLLCSTTETDQLDQGLSGGEFTTASVKSGVNRVLIIWAKFTDANGSPSDVQTIKDNFTVNVNRFYKDNSYGDCTVAPFGDPTKPAKYIEVSTGHTKDYYHFYNGATGGSSAGRTQLRKDALNAAIDAGVDLGDYDLRAIVFSLIDNISANDPWYFWGLTDNVSTIADSESTLFNGKHNVNLIAHEQGHDFGLSHAGDWISGTSDPLYVGDSNNPTTKKTYGDVFDVMGMGFLTTDANYTGHEHYNSRHKNKLGWIGGDGISGHTTDWINVNHNMTNRLYAMDNSKARGNNRTLAIKVHRYAAGTGSKKTDYWIQYRQLFTASKYNLDNGVQILFQGSPMINDGGGDADTTIIDINPGTGAAYPNKPFDVDPDLNDCSLIVGKTLSDTEAGYEIHITPVLRGQTILGDGTALPWIDVVVNTNVSSGNVKPDGNFDMSKTDVSGTTGQLLDLVVNGSDNDGDKLAYYWEFSENNGTTWPINYDNVSTNWVTHAFSSTGTKAVRCRISDMKGQTKLITLSDTIQISTTVPAPNLTTLPISQTVVSGTDVTFTSQADLTTGVKYEWTYSGSGNTVIGTAKNYTRSNVQVGQDDGTYTIKVSNSQGSDSASATLTVQDPVGAVTISPGDTTKAAGDAITMTANVNPAGTSQKYHWYKNDVLLATKTTSSLSFTSLAATDAATYKCIVTNNVSMNEGSMILSVTAGITVTGPTPLNVTNNVGSNVTFTVTASGGTGLQYHWYFNDTTLIPWATTASMTLTNIQMTNDGYYKCVVTNTTATNTSDTAYLKVYWPVTITGNLVSRTNNVGDNAYFNVTATGTNLTYTWYSNSTVIANQTSSNLNLTADTNLLGVNYKVEVGCSDPFYATNTATSAVATVSLPYSGWTRLVQWNMNSLTPDANVTTGTTNNSYSLTAPAGINTNYSNLKSNYIAGSTSDPASTSTDNSAYGYTNGWPTVTGANRTNGIEFRVSTLGYTNVVVTWEQRNSAQASKYWRLIYMTNGLAGTTNIATVHTNLVTNQFVYFSSDLSGKPNVNNNTNLVIRIASEWESTATGGGTAGFVGTQGGTYATNGTAHFDMMGIWGKPQGITITAQPQSVTKAVGDNHTFTVTATGLNPQYQWRSNTVVIAGATASALTLNNIQLNYAASYDCKVTNVINSVTSSAAVLTVLTPPSITVQPQSQTNYTTLASVFTVNATGGGTLTYQWQKNGSPISNGGPISGATTTSLTVANLQTTDAGNYTVVVSNAAGSTTSSPAAVLTVNPLPTDWYWSSDRVSQGGAANWGTANINWGFNPSGPYTYIWQNTNVVSAHFGGTGGAVTLTNGVSVNKIYIESGGYSISGATNLTFAGDNAGLNIPGANNADATNTVNMTCPVSGPLLVKTGGGRLHLHNTANSVGKWLIQGGAVEAQGRSKFFGTPTLPALVPDFITLDGGGFGLVLGGTGWTLNTNDGIYLGANGGKIGVDNTSIAMVLNNPITGPGSLSFPDTNSWPGQTLGKAGSFTLANQNSDYQGSTTIEVGTLVCSNSEVLPDTTTLNVTKNGIVDLGGNDETVAALIVDGANAQLTDGNIYPTTTELRQSGIITASIGSGSVTKTTTNTVTLNMYNSYIGDTTLSAGSVVLNGIGSFGSGTLNLAGANITLTEGGFYTQYNPVVMNADTTIQNGDTSTNVIQWLHDASWSGTAGTLTIRNTTSAAGGSFDLVLGNSFTFSRPIVIGVSGDMPTQLTSYNTNGCSQTFSGVISGVGTLRRSVIADGITLPGRTVLTGANTYSGGTIVDAGTLAINNTSGSGVGAGAVTVSGIGDLTGTGTIGGNVVVNSGTIGAGDGVGVLTLSNGLNLSGGGTNVWELNALNDDAGGAVTGTDYDQLVVSGGSLVLGGSSKLKIVFNGGIEPVDSSTFWRANHTWTIVRLNGGSNPGNTIFASIVNGSYSCGTFTTETDGSGNVILRYTTSISQTLWWSGNNSTLGGAGTWNTTAQNWGVTNVAPFGLVWNNATTNTATFASAGGSVVVGAPVTVNRLVFVSPTNYSLDGSSTITFAGNGAGIDYDTITSSNITAKCVVAGPIITKTGAGRFGFNNTANNVGQWIVKNGFVHTGNVLANPPANGIFGSAPASFMSNFVTLDGGGLGFSALAHGSFSVGANRGIYLGPNGGRIAIADSSATVTFNSPITGPGDLTIPDPSDPQIANGNLGADGIIALSNTTNSWGGATKVRTAELRMGANNVLPSTTTLTLGGGTGLNGRLNLNGFNQTIAAVILDSTGNSRIFGAGSLSATLFDLRSSGYAGGASVSGVLAGSGSLTKTTTGTVSLGAVNTYTGDTTISAGALSIDSIGTFGSGNLYLAGGAIIQGTTRALTNPIMNPLFLTTDSTIQNGDTGAGICQFVFGGALNGGVGVLNVRNTTSASGGSFDVVLTNALSLSQPIVLGVSGDKPVRLTSYNPADATPENTDQAFNGTISGIGSFRRSISSGAGGRTIFGADNTYSGGTTIDAGTLMVNNPGPGTGTGTNTVTVNANGVLCGSGRIGGNVVVNTGGTISAGPAGMLTLTNGLTLNSAGTNVWELTGASDDAVAGKAGVDYDQLVISGGSLVLGGSSKLVLSFPGSVSAPSLSDPFWQYSRTWTIVKLAGGSNPGNTTFSSIVNATNAAGYFTTAISGGSIQLKFKSWATNDLFWSANGTTRGGSGNWTTNTSSTARFGNSSDGPFTQLWSNTSGKGAVFAGTGGSVTNSTNISVSVISVGSDGYTFEGTTNITFSGTGAGVNYSFTDTGDGHKLSFNGPLAGTLFTKTGVGRVHLNNSNNTVSKWLVKEGMISVTTVGRLGAVPASAVADFVKLDGGGLGFDGTSPTMDTNRGITLGTNGGKLGVRSSTVTLTLQNKITGPGGLSFPGYSGFATRVHGGPGTFVMNNTANDYQGDTTVNVGTLKLGAAGVLPDATTLTITGSASVDITNLNETISTLVLSGNGAAVVGTTGTLTATNGFDVRNGTVAGTLGGSGIFTKSTTNVVSITSSNVYKGGTIVDEGTLLVNNTTGSGVGTNTVIVADVDGLAATLGGTGIIGGNVIVNSSGNISPGVVTNAGTLTLTNGLNMTNGGTYTWELANLKDDATGVAGVDFDKLSITGGQLRLDGSSILCVQFLGTNAPDSTVGTFWTLPHTWTIATLSGSAVNVGGCGFSNVVVIPQGNNAGTFSNYVSGNSIKMDFLPNVFTGQSIAMPTAPAFTGSRLVGADLASGVQISWAATAGNSYEVQYTTDLSGEWKVLTEVVADGPTVSITDFPQSDSPQTFYRLIAK